MSPSAFLDAADVAFELIEDEQPEGLEIVRTSAAASASSSGRTDREDEDSARRASSVSAIRSRAETSRRPCQSW